jgi:hypothetical protein
VYPSVEVMLSPRWADEQSVSNASCIGEVPLLLILSKSLGNTPCDPVSYDSFTVQEDSAIKWRQQSAKNLAQIFSMLLFPEYAERIYT